MIRMGDVEPLESTSFQVDGLESAIQESAAPFLEEPETGNRSEAFKEWGSAGTSICQDLHIPSELLEASTMPTTGNSAGISICRGY